MLKECKFLVGTSANLSGSKPLVDPKECDRTLSNYDILIDGGRIQSEGESTVIEINDENVNIIRNGSVTEEEILSVL